ncbi:glycosyltransferase family 4 protein [Flavobacterium sp. SUN052]|uniref:glycosyltransferase family 4 protein n=1 Tax=Flavobacterium sp. SUN052 TaxID=3002441 RepID=UPI00237D712F|nr:glycosyltransferase family 4 protein [Flavobacterium sp. SUN052]MEC4004399.1 glycosyltransferase family 4 protein [Flavobacterium sp. SUN052]
MVVNQKIAIICNYQLLPERVGGMDYFYWMFDKKCKENDIHIDWFFPNTSNHGEYNKLTLFSSNYENVENFFLKNHATANYTHVITHFVELCTLFFKKFKKISTAKLIAVDHNPRPLSGYSLKKQLEKKTKGILYSKYIDLFIGVSNYTVNEILKDFGKHLKNKSITIYNGVLIDSIKIREHRNSIHPKFLVASHLRKSKGIQDLIAAVALLPEEFKKSIVIDVYGDGPYKNQLLNTIAANKLEQNIILKGSVSNLNEIFCEYDYMLQPTHMECFSLSILESLAANVPVITTNVGGNEEAVLNSQNGFIFKVKDTLGLSKILEQLISGEIKIVENTSNLIVEKFSLKKMVDNHIKIII